MKNNLRYILLIGATFSASSIFSMHDLSYLHSLNDARWIRKQEDEQLYGSSLRIMQAGECCAHASTYCCSTGALGILGYLVTSNNLDTQEQIEYGGLATSLFCGAKLCNIIANNAQHEIQRLKDKNY